MNKNKIYDNNNNNNNNNYVSLVIQFYIKEASNTRSSSDALANIMNDGL